MKNYVLELNKAWGSKILWFLSLFEGNLPSSKDENQSILLDQIWFIFFYKHPSKGKKWDWTTFFRHPVDFQQYWGIVSIFFIKIVSIVQGRGIEKIHGR